MGTTDKPTVHDGVSDITGRGSAGPGERPFEYGMQVDTDWHHHDMHQLLYAFDGSVEIKGEDARYLVPHQFAAWIPKAVFTGRASSASAPDPSFFDRDLIPSNGVKVECAYRQGAAADAENGEGIDTLADHERGHGPGR
jgi:hypothetical protein